MEDYISNLINLINSGIKIKSNIDNNLDYELENDLNIHKNKEIFSMSLIVKELISIRKIKNNESFKHLMRKIKNKEPYLTIFNPLIIDIMPKLFEMMENIDKNFIIPFSIQKLIKEKNNILNIPRNINYDYFKQNKKENIQYQSICFSWKNFYLILLIIRNNENKFFDILKKNEHKDIFHKLVYLRNHFIDIYITNEKSKKEQFFY